MAAEFDYCRAVPKVSLRMQLRLWITAATCAAAALPLAAQYPGQIAQSNKDTLNLRAVAVFEWTGDDQAKPKTSRLVPVSIYDGQELQDAGEYLAQPFPLALEGDVEYDLMSDGKPIALFDVDTAAREQGAWMGYGKHLPLPAAKPAPVAKVDEDDAQSDEPVLHRKRHAEDSGSGGAPGNSTTSSGPDPNAPAPDPDRPTLHKSGDASQSTTGDSGSSSSTSASSSDSSGGKLKKKKNEDDGSYVSDVATLTDPNRPHLFRGKSAGFDVAVTPTLVGLPPDMHQEVAVSDPTDRPVHLWDYAWANPGDKAKMKAAMEDLARTALGLNAPPPKPAHKSTSAARKPTPLAPPEPAPLYDEQFRVFELAYGAGATMVLSAHTAGSGEQEKFVTLIAQPDLYGNIAVLVKNVTDADHLDETPRMRLVDAVDALADNRGELLFELRGATQRQFALYRVLRGEASRIFVTDPLTLTVTMAN